MIRSSLGLLLAVAVPGAAAAGDLLSAGQSAKPRADAHCASYGAGFFAVAGSNACVKISGHISAGAAFANGSNATATWNPSLPAGKGADAEIGVNGDMRFDTPAGPGRIYVGARRDTNPRWVLDSQ